MAAPIITPYVRDLSARYGVDPSTLTKGTGVGGRITPEDILAAADAHPTAPAPIITPFVRDLSARYGVDPTTLTGTGVAGRITNKDVFAAAAPSARPQQLAPLSVAGPRVRSSISVGPSTWSSSTQVSIDEYARNPLVDDARQAVPAVYQLAVSEGTAPTLFAAGDLPLFMTSAADPSLLLQLPWLVRHFAARADADTFRGLLEQFGGADGPNEAKVWRSSDSENADYRSRVARWLDGDTSDRQSRTSDYRVQAATEEAYAGLYPDGAPPVNRTPTPW